MRAEDVIRLKQLLPTEMGADEIRRSFPADLLRRSLFSARQASVPYLAQLQDVAARFAGGAVSASEARAELLETLHQMGHRASDGGGVVNPASRRRLNLILETQRRMASSAARMAAETPATLLAWPAWELRRWERRAAPRGDWPRRWQSAAEAVGYEGVARGTGRMVALKTSPVWQALGDGAGGFRDTLGNPFPPFAYSSGLAWEDVDAETARRLGLDPRGGELPRPSVAPSRDEIAEAARRAGFDLGKGLA